MPTIKFGDMPGEFHEVLSMDTPLQPPHDTCPFTVDREAGGLGCALVIKYAGEAGVAGENGVSKDEWDEAVVKVEGASAMDVPNGCPILPLFAKMQTLPPDQSSGREVFIEEGPHGYNPNPFNY